MQDNILFHEKQKFTQWWLWVILLGVGFIFVGTFLIQVIGGTPLGDNPLSNEGYIIGLFLMALFLAFFYYLELETIIKPSGIYVRFFPFHLSFKHYPWDSLCKCYVKQYSPIGDFGGWGVRISLFGKGTAYNVDGDYGLQLEFLTSKKLLIGTQKPQELSTIILTISIYQQANFEKPATRTVPEVSQNRRKGFSKPSAAQNSLPIGWF